jgi:hypothetical protein
MSHSTIDNFQRSFFFPLSKNNIIVSIIQSGSAGPDEKQIFQSYQVNGMFNPFVPLTHNV